MRKLNFEAFHERMCDWCAKDYNPRSIETKHVGGNGFFCCADCAQRAAEMRNRQADLNAQKRRVSKKSPRRGERYTDPENIHQQNLKAYQRRKRKKNVPSA